MVSKKSLPKKSKSSQVRPPVVAVLGHVDHGKTTLLSAIKEVDLTRKEFGGISQHIGAYQVETEKGGITFIDTPGHEAFAKMRSRGAKVADLALLVVAADEGVKAQTLEALDHIKAAKIPFIVVLNKIDLSSANPPKVKKELLEKGVAVEKLGGEIVCCEVSAKRKKGLKNLLEMVLLVAEMEELKADPNAPFEGVIIESKLDPRAGPLATVLVKEGTLRIGQEITAAGVSGKIKALIDERGKRVAEAGPSAPVEVLGLEAVPEVGAKVEEGGRKMENGKWKMEVRNHESRITNNELRIILKSDTSGTLEAVAASLEKLAAEGETGIEFIHRGVGEVSDSDVLLARGTDSLIVGFNVRVPAETKKLAGHEKVEIRTHNVIYDLIEDVKDALAGVLKKEEEKIKGRGEVIAIFPLPSGDIIGGTEIKIGRIKAGDKIKVLRGEEEVFRGEVKKIKQEKNVVRTALAGGKYGLNVKPRFEFKVGDVVEVI